MVEQESKYRCVFVMSKSFLAKPSESRVYKSRRDVDRVINKRVRFNGRDSKSPHRTKKRVTKDKNIWQIIGFISLLILIFAYTFGIEFILFYIFAKEIL